MAAPTHRHRLSLTAIVTMLFLAWELIIQSRPAEPAFPHGQIRIGVDASTPPLAYVEDGELRGLEIDLGRALGTQLGLDAAFVMMGFDGLYDSLLADQVDVVISQLVVSPLRLGDVRYSQPYFDAGLVLIVPDESMIESLDDLAGGSLAVEFGSTADTEARAWLRRVRPFEQRPYERPDIALDAVRLTRADAALTDLISVRLYQRDHPSWNIRLHPVTHQPYAIAIARARPETWRAVEQALAAIIASGQLDALIDRWL